MGISRRQLGAAMLGGLALRRLPALTVRPKLLVLVLLEQLRGDALDNVFAQLSPTGLRRILGNGAFFPDCRHLASTFPATTVATLATGAWPSQHGIVAGLWYDRPNKKAVPASDEGLLATTLAAEFAAEKEHRSFVVSLDAPLGGIFAGSSAVKRYWMDEDGAFATLGATPDWVTNFNGQHPISTWHDVPWHAIGARADAPPLRTLTWSPDRPKDFMALYRSSPFAQSAQVDFAIELIQREGLGQKNDFLCLLLSSSSLLGYEQGADSALMSQMILELDRRMETLLSWLAKNTGGENNFAIVLAGAHGAPPRPEPEVLNSRLVGGENLAQSIDRALAAQSAGRVEKYLYPFLHLDTSGRDAEPVRLQAARAAMQNLKVAGYYTAGDACSTHNDWEKRFRNSFHATRSGDVMLSYRPECIEEYGQGRGISYGSLYNYDVQVPLCFYGPQFRAGAYEAPVESVDVAPTLARILGVGAPSSSVGRVLGEALAT